MAVDDGDAAASATGSGINSEFNAVIEANGISPLFASALEDVRGQFSHIDFIIDTSSTMFELDLGAPQTGIEVVASVLHPLCHMTTAFSGTALELHFYDSLQPVPIHTAEDVDVAMKHRAPHGGSPLIATFNRVLAYRKYGVPGALTRGLIVLATDGLPDDGTLQTLTNRIREVASTERFAVNVLACSFREDVEKMFSSIKSPQTRVDVISPYEKEVAQIKERQGLDFNMTPGDHAVKVLTGAYKRWVGYLDQFWLNQRISEPFNKAAFAAATRVPQPGPPRPVLAAPPPMPAGPPPPYIPPPAIPRSVPSSAPPKRDTCCVVL